MAEPHQDSFEDVTPPRIEGADVSAFTRNHVPSLADAAVTDDWIDLRTAIPDFRPVIGSTRVDGFLVACGMSDPGVALAPVVGRTTADYVRPGATTDRLRILSVDRFRRAPETLSCKRVSRLG